MAARSAAVFSSKALKSASCSGNSLKAADLSSWMLRMSSRVSKEMCTCFSV